MSTNFEKFNDPTRTVLNSEQPKKKKPFLSFSKVVLFRIAGLFIGLLIYLAVAGQIFQSQVVEVKLELLETLTQQRADLTAQNIYAYLKSLRQKVELYTKKPAVIEALAARDEMALKAYEKELAERFPASTGARFIPIGTGKIDSTEFPQIRFSELDMIKRAERREFLPPEAAKVDNVWRLNYVVPLPFDSNQNVVGSLLVSFSLDEMAKHLEADNKRVGKITLIQRYGNGLPIDVLSNGVADYESLKSLAKVEDSHFLVQFSPSKALAAQTHADYILVAILALVSAVVLIGSGWYGGMQVYRIIYARAERKQNELNLDLTAKIKIPGGGDGAHALAHAQDILDIDIAESDEALLGLDDDVSSGAATQEHEVADEIEAAIPSADIPDVVFRAYDIRGIAKEQISKEFARKVGQAVACEALDAGEDTLIVARDARLSSPELTEFLIRGILSTGCNVLNIGTVPTPLMYFATEVLDASRSGVMVTASHNPGHHNGFKIVIDGKCRSEDDIKAIRQRILDERLYQGAGQEHRYDIIPDYIDTIFSDVALAGDISIVVDAANAVPGIVAPRLFEELGCSVTPLFCDLDGNFPNHDPDPSKPENLAALIAKVKEIGADLGVAFDGDGDRLAVVTPKGNIVWPDKLLMLFATDVVSRNPGADVVFDVKCTRHLNACISEAGGRPIMWKTGHSPMKAKMQETGALLGGEYSGHIFIKDRWYGFDDGLYAAARLIEIISLQGVDLDTVFDAFPESLNTPEIRVPVDEDKKFKIIAELLATGQFGEGKITSLDGIRVDFPFGWGLVRASNTGAELTLRFEADNEEIMHRLKALFVRELRKIDNTINVEWNQ